MSGLAWELNLVWYETADKKNDTIKVLSVLSVFKSWFVDTIYYQMLEMLICKSHQEQ